MRAFSVVLAHAAYLPSAECFALLPLAGQLGRTGNENGCDLDYDGESGTVVVKSGRPYRWVWADGRADGRMGLWRWCFVQRGLRRPLRCAARAFRIASRPRTHHHPPDPTNKRTTAGRARRCS